MFGKHIRRNKKGSLLDIIFIAMAITFFSIVVLIGLKIATEFETNIDTNDIFAAGEAREQVELTRVKYTNTIDNMFLFLMIFLAIAVLVLAALVRIHPMFIPFYFIGWIITIFLSGIFSNIYQGMVTNTTLSSVATQLTFMDGVMRAIPIIVGIFGMMLMVVQYKLWQAAQI